MQALELIRATVEPQEAPIGLVKSLIAEGHHDDGILYTFTDIPGIRRVFVQNGELSEPVLYVSVPASARYTQEFGSRHFDVACIYADRVKDQHLLRCLAADEDEGFGAWVTKSGSREFDIDTNKFRGHSTKDMARWLCLEVFKRVQYKAAK